MTHNKQTINLGGIRITGRMRGIAHTGHEYDEDGNVVKYGEVLRESQFGRNTITLSGFNRMLASGSGGIVRMGMVAGDGNTTPTESDTLLTAYLGRYSVKTAITTSRNSNPGAGPLFYRLVYRGTFNPGSFGDVPVNIAEGGITMSVADINDINSSSPIGAHGLMVDDMGAPTTVAVAPDEYFDLVWEYTEWLPSGATGVVSLDIDGVPTDHDYEVRPAFLTPSTSTQSGWTETVLNTATANQTFPSQANRQWFQIMGSGGGFDNQTAAAEGPLGAASEGPQGTYNAANIPSSATMDDYVPNSKERSVTLAWAPSRGNIEGGIGAVNILLGHTQWQVSYDPPIEKEEGKQLSLGFTLALSNA